MVHLESAAYVKLSQHLGTLHGQPEVRGTSYTALYVDVLLVISWIRLSIAPQQAWGVGTLVPLHCSLLVEAC